VFSDEFGVPVSAAFHELVFGVIALFQFLNVKLPEKVFHHATLSVCVAVRATERSHARYFVQAAFNT
jgi:hypothetical protein